jgi:hypothetical protein
MTMPAGKEAFSRDNDTMPRGKQRRLRGIAQRKA